MSELVQLKPGEKCERWTVEKKLGEGAFGAVYKVSDKTGTYALKVEGVNEPIQLLKMEVYVLNELGKAGGRHFCKIEDKGRVNSFNYVVMTFVGKSLAFVHEDGTIKQPRAMAGFRGTVKYAPVACHAQRELCRLDDMETWLYMTVELTKGSLPWRNLKDMNEIGRMKKSCRFDIPMKQLFGGCPREYIDIMRTIDKGNFFEEPDYRRVYSLLRQAMKNLKAQEFPYDWERWAEEEKKREEEKKKQATSGPAKVASAPPESVPKTPAKDKTVKEVEEVHKTEMPAAAKKEDEVEAEPEPKK
ncbi:Tau-tubulin kinase 2 [Aphelenchoides fujianensis]|nr:Tau-tubulin kinase 2 [Aphelenchoides fujianensis]